MILRVRGTQDFLDLTLLNFFLDTAKKHFKEYNFSEISTPILEPLELFKRSLGLETDVVSKQMYIIPDQDGADIVLRPEATASVVRAFVNNNVEITPWKVFLWGPMFRHERPQKGRYRQFNQVSIEVIGSADITQDVQLLKMLDRFFGTQLNLKHYALLINFLGCMSDRAEYKTVLVSFLDSLGDKICSTCTVRKTANSLRVFDCKNESCQDLYKNAPHITDSLCTECAVQWQELKDMLSIMSVSFSHMPTLVRGLDYYNKTVFEFVSTNLGAQNAFCGGGRYDHLVKELGGRIDRPSIGAAIGIERVLLLLEDQKDLIKKSKMLTVILPFSKEQKALALLLADELQVKGLSVDILLEGDSVKNMMKKANKMGADIVLLLGSDEQESRTVTLKVMETGKEIKDILQIDVADILINKSF